MTMLLDLPPFRSPYGEPSLAMAEDEAPPDHEYEDPLDDVFGSGPSSPSEHVEGASGSGERVRVNDAVNLEQSDVPRLRSTHVTNGYRDGIAESKAQFVQQGFDEGYSLGAVLGLKAGRCLGVLEGICRALQSQLESNERHTDEHVTSTYQEAKTSLSQARKDLAIQSLFGPNYFGADGIWTYDVPGQDQEDQVTFQEVSDAHPLVQKWTKNIRDVALRLQLDLDAVRRRDEASPEAS